MILHVYRLTYAPLSGGERRPPNNRRISSFNYSKGSSPDMYFVGIDDIFWHLSLDVDAMHGRLLQEIAKDHS